MNFAKANMGSCSLPYRCFNKEITVRKYLLNTGRLIMYLIIEYEKVNASVQLVFKCYMEGVVYKAGVYQHARYKYLG